eukprot:TRINITY_DN16306_c0_g1_i1.p2 TRINITY_DN16306_c0_g1~~TRINITY_DN16306_c0_g1_i1.p2  ORF type:complete len:133 (-),score=52.72 TRINITY_DN16306_c0_g1_i1:51-449(-)
MAERPEDLNLPTAIVTKMIKDCLPANCKVSKEANVAIAKAASVFVLYATSSANTVAKENSRKTITGGDVVTAMGEMEFDKFVRPLENSLAIWRRGQKDKKDLAAKKKASAVAKKDDASTVSEKDNQDVIEID